MNWNAPASGGLLRTLVSAGMRHVVTSPGSRNTPLSLAAEALSGLEQIMVLDERAAAFLALGLARGTRRPVGLICTSGSALAHYLPALVEASLTHIPLFVLSADRPGHLQDVGAPQTIPQESLFRSFVRFEATGHAPNGKKEAKRWRALGLQAVMAARGRKPGPVHLNLRFDEPLWDPSDEGSYDELEPGEWIPETSHLSPECVAAFLASVKGEKRGIFVIGPNNGAFDEEWNGRFARALRRVSERLEWPVIAEPGSGLWFGDHDKSGIVTHADTLLASRTFAEKARPDIVFRIGGTPTSKRLLQWLEKYADRRRTILLSPHGQWADPDSDVNLVITAPPTSFLEELGQALNPAPEIPNLWTAFWTHANESVEQEFERMNASDSSRNLWEGEAVRLLVKSLEDDENLVVGNSMPIRDLESFGGTTGHRVRVFVQRGANGIDGAVATAFGIHCGTGKKTTLLCGDLTLQHDWGGLLGLVHLGHHLRIVVQSNGGGQIFRNLPISAHSTAFEKCFVTPQHLDLEKVLSGLPIEVKRVSTRHALKGVLERPFSGVQIVLCETEANESVEQRKMWRERACALLDASNSRAPLEVSE